MWVTLDSVRHTGAHWTDTSTNAEDINFNINKRFQFHTVSAAIATIRSQGRISNDKAGTWLLAQRITGRLTGTENGKYYVDTATGMPGEMEDSVSAEGNVQLNGHEVRIKIVKTIKMAGAKLK